MTPVERLLAKLPDAKQAGNGWSARCPAHDDRRASLSIAQGDDGRVLVHCHAGCKPDAICAAVGLKLADLFPSKNGKLAAGGRAFATVEDAIVELERRHGKRSALWTYHDAQGDPVGVTIRWDGPDDKKDVRPISRHTDGWRIGAMLAPRPLYGLPDLAAARRVIICEGEKAADAARSIGFVATTSAGGAQAAEKTDWRPLAGKEVWILPDNDAAGRKYAETVAGILAKLAPAPVVRVVELPGLPERGDIVEWIDAHGDTAEPNGLRAEIEVLAQTVEPWRPDGNGRESRNRWEPDLVCLADVEPQKVPWLWYGRIPLGRITLLVGRPGCGKSFLAADLAAKISTGAHWPDPGFDRAPLGDTLLICAEDDPADTIRPRLDAAGANCRRVHLLKAAKILSDDGNERSVAFDLSNVDLIRDALDQLPHCKLVVIDPIGSFLGGRVDAHRDNEIRSVLAPLAAIASERGVAVTLVCHTRKALAPYADDMALGSRGFVGLSRSVLHLMADPDNRERRWLLAGKNNLSAPAPGLAFRIVGDPARLEWEPDPVAMTADDMLIVENQSRGQKPGPEADAVKAAAEWLRSALAGGARLAKELKDEWINGQGGSERTLKRAKKSLEVEAFRPKTPGPWWWQLANKEASNPKGEHLGPLGPLAKNNGKSIISDAGECKGAKLDDLGPLDVHDAEDGHSPNTASPPGGSDPDGPAAKGGLPGAEFRVEDPDQTANVLCQHVNMSTKPPRGQAPCQRNPENLRENRGFVDVDIVGNPVGPVCRCGSTTWRDVTLHHAPHNGTTIRRDCAGCGRFFDFPVWYGKDTGHNGCPERPGRVFATKKGR